MLDAPFEVFSILDGVKDLFTVPRPVGCINIYLYVSYGYHQLSSLFCQWHPVLSIFFWHLSYWVDKCFHLDGQQTVKHTKHVHLIPSLKMRGTLATNPQHIYCVLLI